MRKNVLRYDDVMNAQRKEVYAQRKEFMRTAGRVRNHRRHAGRNHRPSGPARVPERGLTENWELAELAADLQRVLNVNLPIDQWGREDGMDEAALEERIEEAAGVCVGERTRFGADTMRFIEKAC